MSTKQKDTTKPQNRLDNGKFAPGNCANPGGRPKLPMELKARCQSLTPEAVDVWCTIMRDTGARCSDRIRAAENIVDRGYGRPTQAVEVNWNDATAEQRAARLAELHAIIAQRATGNADDIRVGSGDSDRLN